MTGHDGRRAVPYAPPIDDILGAIAYVEPGREAGAGELLGEFGRLASEVSRLRTRWGTPPAPGWRRMAPYGSLRADELSLGLAPLVVVRLLEAPRAAALERRVGILLVEQQVRNALLYSDRAYVLSRGSIVLEGRSSELMEDIAQVEASYLSAVP